MGETWESCHLWTPRCPKKHVAFPYLEVIAIFPNNLFAHPFPWDPPCKTASLSFRNGRDANACTRLCKIPLSKRALWWKINKVNCLHHQPHTICTSNKLFTIAQRLRSRPNIDHATIRTFAWARRSPNHHFVQFNDSPISLIWMAERKPCVYPTHCLRLPSVSTLISHVAHSIRQEEALS